MVCLGDIRVNTPYKGDKDKDDNNNKTKVRRCYIVRLKMYNHRRLICFEKKQTTDHSLYSINMVQIIPIGITKIVIENTLQFATQLCDPSSREINRKHSCRDQSLEICLTSGFLSKKLFKYFHFQVRHPRCVLQQLIEYIYIYNLQSNTTFIM